MRFPRIQKKISVFLLFFLAFVLAFSFQKDLKNFFYSLSFPLQKEIWREAMKISAFFRGILKSSQLEKENYLLRTENQKLLFENLQLQELKKENEALRKALGASLNREFSLQIAKVAGRDFFEDYILIDKGQKDGISTDLPVITESKVLVGKIKQVYKNFSKVELLSAKNFIFDVKIKDREIYGKAVGQGGFQLLIDHLPIKEKIEIGEIIVTSGEGGIFPENLLVGKINAIKKSDIESFQKARVSSMVEFSQLEYLFILKEW